MTRPRSFTSRATREYVPGGSQDEDVAADFGRELTEQEIWLSLAQARMVGELPQIGGVGSGYRVEG